MASQLTKADVAGLLDAPTEEARAKIAQTVGTQVGSGALTGQERMLANEILRLMVRDAADRVRSAVAATIAKSADIPGDVAQRLANDIDDIAVPFLETSPALSDEDLIAIVRSGGDAKALAIAGRETVSEGVSEAIATDASKAAVTRLLENEGAQIDTVGYSAVMDRWEGDQSVTATMALRENLPVNVTERLVTMVSDEVKLRLISRHDIGVELAERMSLEAREAATIGLLDGLPGVEDYALLMEHLNVSGRLSGSLIVRAACMGEIQFVEYALAQLARIKPDRAWTLVHDAGKLGLRALFQQAKLPQDLYLPLRTAVDVFHEMSLNGEVHDREHFRRQIMERILTQPDGLKGEDLDFLLYQISRQEQKIASREAEAVRAASA